MRMNDDDWTVIGDRCVVLVCVLVIFLYAIGVVR